MNVTLEHKLNLIRKNSNNSASFINDVEKSISDLRYVALKFRGTSVGRYASSKEKALTRALNLAKQGKQDEHATVA